MEDGLFVTSKEFQDWLVIRPETGMGYQLLSLPRRAFALVIATTYVVQFRTRQELFDRLQLLQISLNNTRAQASPIWGKTDSSDTGPWRIPEEWMGATVVEREDAVATNYLQAGPLRRTKSKSVELVHQIPQADQPRMFFRFSATERDWRVNERGELADGTYATTFNDLRMIPSGLAAVGRYALPIPESARYVRSVVTDASHRMGTALPRFSQSGGGVEVKFENGARPTPDRAHQMDLG